MQKKIYVVNELNLDCGFKRLLCAFITEDQAFEYTKEMVKKYKQESVFDNELWQEIDEKLIDFIDSLDEDQYVNPHEGGTEEWENWNKEFEKFAKEKYVELFHEHGLTDVTVRDVEKQIDYNFYKGKNLTFQVEELTLYI